jgi:hypothetical protein
VSCKRPNTPRSDAKSIAELEEPLRSRIWTAVQHAPTKGLVLVSGYRDPGRQWDLRHDRCPGRECDPSCKGFPVTAVPAQLAISGKWVGGSKHQHRKAADMGGRDLDWLIRNRFAYGLGLTVSSENWHFEASGRDARTGRQIPAPSVPIMVFGGLVAVPPPPQIERQLFMALSDAEETEILDGIREMRKNLPRKAFVLRDPRNASVWVFSGAGRWHVRNMTGLNLLIWTGQVAGLGSEGIPVGTAAQFDAIPEIDAPFDWDELESRLTT